MTLKSRLVRIERRTESTRTRYVWLDAGETQEEALARLGRSLCHAESVVFIRWMTESETRTHGLA